MIDFASARRTMVDNQLRTYDIIDPPVVAAFDKVPREHFVDERQTAIAYLDRELVARGSQRRMMTPLVLGRLIQALDVKPGDKLLDVAGGSGYAAAIFNAMGADVTALESSADSTTSALASAGISGVKVVSGAVNQGIGTGYNVIFVNGAVESDPISLLDLLAEGGRLGAVVGTGRSGRATVYRKINGMISRAVVFDALAPLVPEFAGKPAFQF